MSTLQRACWLTTCIPISIRVITHELEPTFVNNTSGGTIHVSCTTCTATPFSTPNETHFSSLLNSSTSYSIFANTCFALHSCASSNTLPGILFLFSAVSQYSGIPFLSRSSFKTCKDRSIKSVLAGDMRCASRSCKERTKRPMTGTSPAASVDAIASAVLSSHLKSVRNQHTTARSRMTCVRNPAASTRALVRLVWGVGMLPSR